MGRESGNGPPGLAGKLFTFWAHIMASYLQSQHHDAWRTTLYPLPTVSTESEAKWNAHARNHIFEAPDEELFDRVFALQTVHEVWMELKEIHVGSKKIREEKYELLKLELNEFKMKDDKRVEQMYSRTGVLIQSINALDVANLSEQEIIRKMLQTLPKPRYNIVKALLFEKDFTTLTITKVVSKIRSHEMFMMEYMESSTSHSSAKKDLALKESEKAKSKKINAKPPSSSSESEDKSESSEAESDDASLLSTLKEPQECSPTLAKRATIMIPRSKSSELQEEVVREAIRSATIVEAMIISHMIAPSPTSECQTQARRTMKMTKMPSTTRRSHPRKSHQTSPTTRRRVNIVLYWSMNGLPVVKLQVNQVRKKKTRTRRLPVLLS
jgi:hypothetical protein